MIKLFEVRFELENGSTLSVLMAAGTAEEAKRFAADTLRATAEPRADRDALRYCWRYDEITVREVEINELPGHDAIHEMHMQGFGSAA